MNLPYDPAILETEESYIAELFHQYSLGVESCIPCIVSKFDAENWTVDLQPIPTRMATEEGKLKAYNRPVIPSIPVLQFSHGGYSIHAPLFIGDTGYLIAVDRNCDTAIQHNSTTLYTDDANYDKNKGPLPPDDLSLCRYSHGFFLPCSWSKEGNHNGELVIEGIGKQSNDGKWQKIRLSNDGTITIETKDGQIIVGENGVNLSSGDVKLSVLNDKIVSNCGDSRIEQSKDSVEIKHGTNKIVLDKNGITYSGNVDSSGTILADIMYDKSSHQIQVKRQPVAKCGNILVNVGDPGDWEMITGGQAVELPTEN